MKRSSFLKSISLLSLYPLLSFSENEKDEVLSIVRGKIEDAHGHIKSCKENGSYNCGCIYNVTPDEAKKIISFKNKYIASNEFGVYHERLKIGAKVGVNQDEFVFILVR